MRRGTRTPPRRPIRVPQRGGVLQPVPAPQNISRVAATLHTESLTQSCKPRCRDKEACKHLCCKWIPGHGTRGASRRRLLSIINADPVRHGGSSEPSIHLHEREGATETMQITEVLEMILQYLTPFDLSGMRRVDKQWNNVIQGKALRRARFLDAEVSVADDRPPRHSHFRNLEDKTKVWIPNDTLFVPQSLSLEPDSIVLGFLQDPLLARDDNAHLSCFITHPPATEVSFTYTMFAVIKPTLIGEAQMRRVKRSTIMQKPGGIKYRDFVQYIKIHAAHSAWVGVDEAVIRLDLFRSYVRVEGHLLEPVSEVEWVAEWNARCRKEINE